MTTMTTTVAGTQPRPAQTSATAHGGTGAAGTGAASTGTARTCTGTTPGVPTHGAITRGAMTRSLAAAGRRRWDRAVAPGKDAGMATAEYAIAMIAAVGFAGLLVAVLTSATVRELLTGLVTSALSYG